VFWKLLLAPKQPELIGARSAEAKRLYARVLLCHSVASLILQWFLLRGKKFELGENFQVGKGTLSPLSFGLQNLFRSEYRGKRGQGPLPDLKIVPD
jgi:hypothetical protein